MTVAAAEQQDIPVEASETLAFTPACLSEIKGAPSFVLRTGTRREKRMHKRMLIEEGAVLHSTEAVRAEMLRGLRQCWTEEQYSEHAPRLEAYWHAWDDFQTQKKLDPDLEWQWNAEEEAKIVQLWNEVAQGHRPLAVMNANNREANELTTISIVAVMIESYSGLETPPQKARKYLTIDCVDAIREELGEFEDDHNLKPGVAWAELSFKAMRQMFLDEDEVKNSASPSPSTSPPQSSKETADALGQSKVSEPSTTIPTAS